MTPETLAKMGITREQWDNGMMEMERDGIYQIYQKFRELIKVSKDRYASLCLRNEEEGGVIDDSRNWWLDWSSADEALSKMNQAIEEIKAEE